MTAPDIQRTIEAAWRIESARLIGALARLRRRTLADQKHRQLEYEIEVGAADLLDTEGDDDLLRLVFTACHPVLPPDERERQLLGERAGRCAMVICDDNTER